MSFFSKVFGGGGSGGFGGAITRMVRAAPQAAPQGQGRYAVQRKTAKHTNGPGNTVQAIGAPAMMAGVGQAGLTSGLVTKLVK